MPKKKGSSTSKILVVVLLIAIIGVAFVGWHDGKIGVTPLGSINDLSVSGTTPVRVRGTISVILLTAVTISDGTGSVIFLWADADSLTVGSIIVVTGEVTSAHWLGDVTSVQVVWLFA
ncbi:MAG: hypothetical protein RTV31_00060 [Candidatus Thorarchaeota archaeon]